MPLLFRSITSSPFCIHWTCLTCENDLAQSNTVCCANKHLHEILYLVTSFHYYSPLGFVLVLIWSGLSIKLQKITANKFCDMTFGLRCLHFEPLNICKHIPLFSLPKVKNKNSLNSGCTTKLGWKLFTSVPWILSNLFGGAVVMCLAGHGTWYWPLLLEYCTAAERSDGRLIFLWNIYNTNLRTRASIFGSWGECTGCPIRTRVQCPVNHPSITGQESVRISAWLFPVHHVPFQCSYQDLSS